VDLADSADHGQVLSASAIQPPYRRRDIGSPGWTRTGFPSGSPAISTQSSRLPPTDMVLVLTSMDTGSPPFLACFIHSSKSFTRGHGAIPGSISALGAAERLAMRKLTDAYAHCID
jgi:hypothetical protein